MEVLGKATIFSKEFNGNISYSLGLNKKDRNNNYINGYMPCNFKKGVNIANKTKIEITKGWVDFYINKDNKTVPTIFISEFKIIDENPINQFEKIDNGLPEEDVSDLLPF